jgi:hypothetical protein
VKQRADLEKCWHTVVRFVDADEHRRPGQHCHLWMANVVCLAARHHEPERLEGTSPKQIAIGLERHDIDFTLDLLRPATRRWADWMAMTLFFIIEPDDFPPCGRAIAAWFVGQALA